MKVFVETAPPPRRSAQEVMNDYIRERVASGDFDQIFVCQRCDGNVWLPERVTEFFNTPDGIRMVYNSVCRRFHHSQKIFVDLTTEESEKEIQRDLERNSTRLQPLRDQNRAPFYVKAQEA